MDNKPCSLPVDNILPVTASFRCVMVRFGSHQFLRSHVSGECAVFGILRHNESLARIANEFRSRRRRIIPMLFGLVRCHHLADNPGGRSCSYDGGRPSAILDCAGNSVRKIGFQALPKEFYEGRAGKGNRTLIASLEGWSFTIKLCPRFAEKT
jgi:hypothetical protein